MLCNAAKLPPALLVMMWVHHGQHSVWLLGCIAKLT
jgi:hypothetical protein